MDGYNAFWKLLSSPKPRNNMWQKPGVMIIYHFDWNTGVSLHAKSWFHGSFCDMHGVCVDITIETLLQELCLTTDSGIHYLHKTATVMSHKKSVVWDHLEIDSDILIKVICVIFSWTSSMQYKYFHYFEVSKNCAFWNITLSNQTNWILAPDSISSYPDSYFPAYISSFCTIL